ncbi:putative oxidoreductase chloroplastic [Dissostichus eleginoides]|uniref:Oxidoreductase chloroplastic n=1 Tax=Dissostichus eleginoides TaxID=100907 RepID=A0AAD9CC57_DISEL|nr:putative oxidoreductase chloroplastic [Dissostichus eleginoides]
MRCKSGNSTPGLQSLTKYVPRPGPMDRKVVLKALQRSMARMHVDSLDCVQFHWWDYRDKRYLDALGHLSDLQQEGLIRELSLTNFDTQRLEEITSRGIHISSNQVQYSLIDQRPAARMEQFCVANNILLLTYGTLAGGLLSERYLGKTEPNSRAELYTASLSKYKKMIDSGGAGAFSRTSSLPWRPLPGHTTARWPPRPEANGGDLAAIETVTRRSRDLMALIGDCGDEYRS